MLRAYRLGQARVQQELITRIAARKASADEVAEAARDLSSAAFGFVDLVAEEVVAAYQAERDDWMHQRNAARLAKITSLLTARTGDLRGQVSAIETALGYQLAQAGHRAAVFWCEADGASRLARRWWSRRTRPPCGCGSRSARGSRLRHRPAPGW
jgi:hypothetical protein